MPPTIASFEDGRKGPHAKECRQHLEAKNHTQPKASKKTEILDLHCIKLNSANKLNHLGNSFLRASKKDRALLAS